MKRLTLWTLAGALSLGTFALAQAQTAPSPAGQSMASAFWNLILALWPFGAVGATEILTYLSKKVKRIPTLPFVARYGITFGIAALLRFMPESQGEVDPANLQEALSQFMMAVLGAIKSRDVAKTAIVEKTLDLK